MWSLTCLVKDLASNKILLQDIKHNGLYVVSSSTSQALLCEKILLQQWHHHFYHVSESVLHHMVTSNTIIKGI
jgi:hypothetical protein